MNGEKEIRPGEVDFNVVNLNHWQKRLRKSINDALANNKEIISGLNYLPVDGCDEQALYMIQIEMDYRHYDQALSLSLAKDPHYSWSSIVQEANTISPGTTAGILEYQFNLIQAQSDPRMALQRDRLKETVAKGDSHLEQVEAYCHQFDIEGLVKMADALGRYTQEQGEWIKVLEVINGY